MNWNDFLLEESNKDYYKLLQEKIAERRAVTTVFPKEDDVLNAFKNTPLNKIKVVIIGQDPYHEKGQATGYAFSVPKGIKIPKSLNNIFKEISDEYGYEKPTSGDLSSWIEQGVFLLNTCLTVDEGNANSHQKFGWNIFVKNAIKLINEQPQPIVYLLWGRNAEEYRDLVTNRKHIALVSPHPSPFSARKGFFGNNHFKNANEFLIMNRIEPIDWQIP